MTADPEAAETYLRLLAETELRQAAQSGLYWRRYRYRVYHAAGALAAAGAIDGPVADGISRELEAALALRNPDRSDHGTLRQFALSPSRPGFTPSAPPSLSPPAPPAGQRTDVMAGLTPARVTVDPASPASPGERLLDAIAIGLLTRVPQPGLSRSLDDIVAALEAAHALPPDSLALSRLATVCRQAPLDTLPRFAAAPAEGGLPVAGLPASWTSLLVYSARRRKPVVKHGAAPLAVVLPELDGVRFVLTGLRSQTGHSLLTVATGGLAHDDYGHRIGFPWSQWFPCWLRAGTGQWHVAEPGRDYQDVATISLRVVPPIPRSVTRLDVIITGRSARITATVPVGWVAGGG